MGNTVDLYGMASPNVTKISLMLAELALPFRFHYVNVFAEEQFTPEFLRNNPNHKVPVLVDQDGPNGEPVTLFESGAILIYLAEKTGRFLSLPSSSRRYEELKWLMIQLTGFGPMCGQYVHFSRYAPPGNDYARQRYYNEVQRLYRVLDQRVAESPYLGGPVYSIADISMYPWAALHDYQGLPWDDVPHVQKWFDRISERPAVRETVRQLEPLMQRGAADVANASPRARERFFNRNLHV
jgi:GST-like protein